MSYVDVLRCHCHRRNLLLPSIPEIYILAPRNLRLPPAPAFAVNPAVQFGNVALIGLGLLGGSLGMALTRRGAARQITGYVRRESTAREARDLGAVHVATSDLAASVADADLVVLCTPIGQMADLARHMAPHLKSGAIITDVGSVKAPLVETLEPIFAEAECEFVGSHPMAGGEKTGVSHARASLFDNALCVVTPSARSKPVAVETVEALWASVSARTLRMSATQHDELVSRSSHLPHVVAAALASYVLSPAHAAEQAALCASGFRDTTRIASGSPEMWRDIALTNRTFLARALGVFIADLQDIQRALNEGDTAGISEFFDQAKRRRDAWANLCVPPTP